MNAHPGRARRHQRASTLVELMTVLAIAAILLAVGAPDMRRMLRAHRLNAAVTDLFNALGLARAQAIMRGSRVELVPAADDGVDWSRGWVVMVDRDGDRRPGPGDDIIAMHGALDEGITIASVFTTGKKPSYVAYNGAGRSCSDTSTLAARWGSFSVTSFDQVRRIRINMLGRARICDPARDGPSCGATE